MLSPVHTYAHASSMWHAVVTQLELLISGMPDVNIEDLKANTEYVGYTSASAVIIWFWQVIDAMNREVCSVPAAFAPGFGARLG